MIWHTQTAALLRALRDPRTMHSVSFSTALKVWCASATTLAATLSVSFAWDLKKRKLLRCQCLYFRTSKASKLSTSAKLAVVASVSLAEAMASRRVSSAPGVLPMSSLLSYASDRFARHLCELGI